MSDHEYRVPRILYLTKVFPYPPAVAGDAVYSRGLIQAWASVADLTVLCADNGGERSLGTAAVEWHVTTHPRSGRARSVLSRFPLIAWKGATSEHRSKLDQLLRESVWDAIVLDNIGLAHALPRVEGYLSNHPETRLIYVSHEWEYPTRAGKYGQYEMGFAKRLMAKLDLRKVQRWEDALITKTDIVTVINTSDLTAFRSIDPSRKYLPILPGYDGPISPGRTITHDVPRRVLLLGGRRSEQKKQVLLDWLAVGYGPLTAADIEVTVVGDIDDDLRSRLTTEYPKVEALGFAADLDGVVSQARAGLIVDTVGSGFKIRLLSHVFQRLPVVGLSSAIDGLPTPEGEGYLAAPTLEELVGLVCQVIDEPQRLNAVQERAFADCELAFSWDQRASTLAASLGAGADQVLL